MKAFFMKGNHNMKNIKKYCCCFFAAAAVISDSVFAADTSSYDLTVNGNQIYVQTYVENDTLMVPAAEVSKALGYKTDYNKELGRIFINDDYIQQAVLFDGSDEAFFNGKLQVINMTREVINTEKTTIIDGTVYVPADFFKEFFNNVSYNGNTVDISPSVCTIY